MSWLSDLLGTSSKDPEISYASSPQQDAVYARLMPLLDKMVASAENPIQWQSMPLRQPGQPAPQQQLRPPQRPPGGGGMQPPAVTPGFGMPPTAGSNPSDLINQARNQGVPINPNQGPDLAGAATSAIAGATKSPANMGIGSGTIDSLTASIDRMSPMQKIAALGIVPGLSTAILAGKGLYDMGTTGYNAYQDAKANAPALEDIASGAILPWNEGYGETTSGELLGDTLGNKNPADVISANENTFETIGRNVGTFLGGGMSTPSVSVPDLSFLDDVSFGSIPSFDLSGVDDFLFDVTPSFNLNDPFQNFNPLDYRLDPPSWLYDPASGFSGMFDMIGRPSDYFGTGGRV